MGDPAKNLNETLWGVDLETGEIYDPNAEIKAKELPRVACWLRQVDKEQARLRAFRQAEVNRIAECTQAALDKLENKKQYFLQRAEGLIRQTGDKKLEYPGYGTFKISTTRESVNDSEYKELDEDKKAEIHKDYSDYFRVKTTVAPDKRKILESLKSESVIPGFSVNEKRETFIFKAEVDDVG